MISQHIVLFEVNSAAIETMQCAGWSSSASWCRITPCTTGHRLDVSQFDAGSNRRLLPICGSSQLGFDLSIFPAEMTATEKLVGMHCP